MGKAGPKILVINDTPEILDLFRDLLTTEGYTVATNRFAANLGDVLGQARELDPDLIVLDFIIGGEPLGWQFLQMLRMDRQTKEVPVVVCTAAADLVRELGGHLDQMHVGVVLKPFDIDQLLEVIGRLLEPGPYTPPGGTAPAAG